LNSISKFVQIQIQFSNFGYGFKIPDYLEGTKEAKASLPGSYSFQNVEIEVFKKSD
jgi:hypothetical protein